MCSKPATQFGDYPTIQTALGIAIQTLRSRYSPLGILAGARHFSDLWTRDFCYASWGALALNDVDIVKTGLTTILQFQLQNGQVPLRVGQPSFILKYLGVNANPPKARYIDDKGYSAPVDNNSLLVITADKYLTHTQDASFLTTHYAQIKRAFEWNLSQDRDHDLLIEEGPYAGWADSVKRVGKVGYTNILHAAAAHAMARLASSANDPDANHFEMLFNRLSARILATFWVDTHLQDWVTPAGTQPSLAADVNLLAIVFDLVPLANAQHIFTTMAERQMIDAFTPETNSPRYPASHTYWLFNLIGMGDYHNGLQWGWLGSINAVALAHCGRYDEAISQLHRLSEKICEYNGIYEVYDAGKPVKRWVYQSEESFAWTSGLLIWACEAVGIRYA